MIRWLKAQLAFSAPGITGGQYSAFRVTFGVYLLVHFLHLLPYAKETFSNQGVISNASDSPLVGLFPNLLAVVDTPAVAIAFVAFGAFLTLPLALGRFDRVAAVLLWYVWACLYGRNPLIGNPGLPYVGWMLLAHTLVPPAPFGSLSARGRPDPGNGWVMPPLLFAAAWFLMAAGYSFSGVTKLVSPSWLDGTALVRVLESPLARPTLLREVMLALPEVLLQALTYGLLAFEVLFLPLAVFKKLRPLLWLSMLAMHFGILLFVDFADLTLGMVMLHLFTFDPAWVRPLFPQHTDRVFYDGDCGVCHGGVRFLLAEDTGAAFRFAPLESDAFQALPEARRAGLPDTIIVLTEDDRLLVRSAAVRHLLLRLGGGWRVLGQLLALVPRPLLDAAYDGFARVRYHIFSKPEGVCPVIPPTLRRRFDT